MELPSRPVARTCGGIGGPRAERSLGPQGGGGLRRSRCSAAADPGTRHLGSCRFWLLLPEESRSPGPFHGFLGSGARGSSASPGAVAFWSGPAASGRCPDAWCVASLSSRAPTAALLSELETELRERLLSWAGGRRGGGRICSTALREAANQ